MKNALFIPQSEIESLIYNSLKAEGHNVDSMVLVSLTHNGATILGVERAEAGVDAGADAGAPGIAIIVASDGPPVGEPEVLGPHDQVLRCVANTPRTVREIAHKLDAHPSQVAQVLSDLGGQVEKVSPARENGVTVSKWMTTGSGAHLVITTAEKERIETRVGELKGAILESMPKFHERRVERPGIVAAIVARSAHEDQAEQVQRDARAVFYRMAEKGLLEHEGNTWRAGKSDTDKINVSMLQGAIREVLVQADGGLSKDQIAKRLPALVESTFLKHAIRRMDALYEQDGKLHLN